MRARLLLIFALVAPAVEAQWEWGPNQARFLQVKAFDGTFSSTVKLSGVGKIGGGSPGPYSIEMTASGTIHNAVWNPDRLGWTGTADGSGTIDVEATEVVSENCTFKYSLKGGGPLIEAYSGQPIKAFITLDDRSDTYSLTFSDTDFPAQWVEITDCISQGTAERPSGANWYPNLPLSGLAFPESGFSLSGQKSVTGAAYFVITPDGTLPGYQFTWSLWPAGTEDTELIVDMPAYQNWRPTAGAGCSSGMPLDVTARLQNKDGSAVQTPAVKLYWELAGTSREPGCAMNAPVQSPSTDYDLRFLEGATLHVDDGTGQKATTSSDPGSGGLTSASAQIAPADWGAWSNLKVTAELTDGRKIAGHLAGEPDTTLIRLPRRFADSFIAQNWLESRQLSGWGDGDDSESDPEGDGYDGDGLTLYEEYRGFIEAGQHIEGDPKKKDFFVRNRGSDTLAAGIRTFARLTGLAVHYRLEESEFPSSRVINGNFSAGPHRVDQHGVLIVLNPTIHGFMEAVGGPGNPKMISYIQAPATGIITGQPGDAGFLEYQNLSLAHELLHACNVWHHGQASKQVLWTRPANSETVLEDGVPIDLRNESGAPAWSQIPSGTEDPKTGQWTHGYRARLGLPQSVYSGVENCVMRYDDASGYPSAADPKVRYKVKETLAHELCDGRVGTGVNDSAHQPQSRYGDAASGRGFCRSQILVNDAVTAPGR